MCCTKLSLVINLIYSGQQVFPYKYVALERENFKYLLFLDTYKYFPPSPLFLGKTAAYPAGWSRQIG
jgi:hypothetical protein